MTTVRNPLSQTAEPFITPPPLVPGSLIAIASPASIVDSSYVARAAEALLTAGFRVRVMPHALDCCGTFAGNLDQRLADFTEAFTDPEIRAILCSRGGYGCIQLLASLDSLPLRADPKWLIGFSDVTALHALMFRHGIASVHASMAKSLALYPLHAEPNRSLLSILSGHAATDPVRSAIADGSSPQLVIGGNMALLQALIGTPFDMMSNALARAKSAFVPDASPAGITLFIEDISEPLYRVNRMLWQMKLAGWFDNISRLVVGQFTNYRPDANYADANSMIHDFFADTDISVTFDAPIGHTDSNLPILLGPAM